MVLLEIEEFRDFLVQLGQLDQEELKVPKEKEEMLVLPVKRDQVGLLVFRDPLDQLEQGVNEERKVLLVNRELLVLVEDQGTRDLLEPLALWVHLDPQVYLDHQEKLGLPDQQENVVNVVLLVPLVLLDLLGQLVNLDHLGYKEYLENKDPLDLMDLWDKWVILVRLVQEELKEKKENVVHQVSLDQWAHLDLQEKDLALTWQLYPL